MLAIAFIAIVGLLAMHGLALFGSGLGAVETRDHETMRHIAAPLALAAVERGPDLSDHLHVLLGCLVIVVTGMAIIVARSWPRGRDAARAALTVVHVSPLPTQRAPPSAVRLSLVGVSRR